MLDIYTMATFEPKELSCVYPPMRQKIIENTKNPSLKKARYLVWRLLEYAVKESLGLTLNDISPYLCENGKWLSDKCWFSLSHTDTALAVAISDQPVGIDIEAKRMVDVEAFTRRILTQNESMLSDTQEDKNGYIIELWTKKESIYKTYCLPPFIPAKIECNDYSTLSYVENVGGVKCYVSVCSEKLCDVKIFRISNLDNE